MTKISPENLARLDTIGNLRKTYDSAEKDLRITLEAQIRASLAANRTRLEDEMAAAFMTGVSVRQIGKAYGSSDFNTVKRWIDAGVARLGVPASTAITPKNQGHPPTVTPVAETVLGRPGWSLVWSDGESGQVVPTDEGFKLVAANATVKARWADPALVVAVTPLLV